MCFIPIVVKRFYNMLWNARLASKPIRIYVEILE